MAILKINENKKLSHIEPEIYGHFSEHLGRCIYEGMYVGENSAIPNENGMRSDVVNALKELKKEHPYLFEGHRAPPYAPGTGTGGEPAPQGPVTLAGALRQKMRK